MSAYAWNEGTFVSDIFDILNFADTSKKRINPSVKEKWGYFQVLNNGDFKMIGDHLLVVSPSWQILSSTLESFENLGAPRGTILKNRINILITLAQAIGHETSDLETYFSNSSKIKQQKMISF